MSWVGPHQYRVPKVGLYLCLSETELILRQGNVRQDDVSGLLRLDTISDQVGAQNFVSVCVGHGARVNNGMGDNKRGGSGDISTMMRKMGLIKG